MRLVKYKKNKKKQKGVMLKYPSAVWDKAIDQSVRVTKESVEL